MAGPGYESLTENSGMTSPAGPRMARVFIFFPAGGGFFNVWGMRFDPVHGKPVGQPFKILVAFDLVFLLLLASTYGLYLARIHKNLMGRPIFIVDRDLTILNQPADRQERASAAVRSQKA